MGVGSRLVAVNAGRRPAMSKNGHEFKDAPVKNTILAAAVIAALAGCGNEEEMNKLKAERDKAQADARTAETAKADALKAKDASAAEAAKTKQEVEAAKQAQAEAQKAKDALAAEVAKAKQEIDAAKQAQADAQKAKDALAAEVAKAKQDLDAARAANTNEGLTKQIAELGGRLKDVETKAAAKDQEAAQAKAAAEAAAAKAAALEQQLKQQQTQPLAAALDRLAYGGKETLSPYLMLPLSFNAKKGETLKWSWSVTEGPKDLSADALEFFVVGPDGSKAYAVRAGWQKKDDKGTLAATADGRWTVVWSNRHPAGAFAIQYEAALAAAP